MRRLSVLLLAVLGVLALLPGLAIADDGSDVAPSGLTVLAAEDAPPAGPEPAPRDADENPARDLGDYGDRDVPFTWGAAWLLAGLGFIGVALLLAFYRFRVQPVRKDRAST
ncbi:MAG: hypothetical protein R6V28_00775 [Nitriliruptoraceae bacterium]